MDQPTTILVIENDLYTGRLQQEILREIGYEVRHVKDGNSALAFVEKERPDLIVLDLSLPDMDGLDLLAKLKAIVDAPVIVCSATTLGRGVVLSFNLGVVDFIPKPFQIDEFIERVDIALGRTVLGPLEINRQRSRVTLHGRLIRLTPAEFGTLCALAEHPGKTVSRDKLAEILWDHPELPGSRALDMQIQRLRKKLHQEEKQPTPTIVNVRGFGFKLVVPDGTTPPGSSVT